MVGDGDLLRQARQELYLARVLVRALRNRTKTDAAALFDSEQRIDALLKQIEEPHAQGGPGSNGNSEQVHAARQ